MTAPLTWALLDRPDAPRNITARIRGWFHRFSGQEPPPSAPNRSDPVTVETCHTLLSAGYVLLVEDGGTDPDRHLLDILYILLLLEQADPGLRVVVPWLALCCDIAATGATGGPVLDQLAPVLAISSDLAEMIEGGRYTSETAGRIAGWTLKIQTTIGERLGEKLKSDRKGWSRADNWYRQSIDALVDLLYQRIGGPPAPATVVH